MGKDNKNILVVPILILIAVIAFSWLSLTKLGNTGDGDPVLSPLRILNNNIIGISIAGLILIGYLWKKE